MAVVTVDLADLGTLIRERREALGLSRSRLARFSGLLRRMLPGLEAGEPSNVGVSRVPHLLSRCRLTRLATR